MLLKIYKGFDYFFLSGLNEKPLIDSPIESKLNVLKYDNKTRKKLAIALLSLSDEDEDIVWITYEEYTLIKSEVDESIKNDGLIIKVLKNNLYPEYYPLSFDITPELFSELINKQENLIKKENESLECTKYFAIYNSILQINNTYYGSFYNYEFNREDNINSESFYPSNITITDGYMPGDYSLFINEDIETYLRDLTKIMILKPSRISLTSTNGPISKRILSSFSAYCLSKNIKVEYYHEKLSSEIQIENELIDIAKKDINIKDFTDFRQLKFYKNPDINNEVIDISQSTIIRNIITQAENAYTQANKNTFRDIFITAPTGAGKSLMFQIPAIYLAKKYKKLTIIIEPVKALMQDQKEKLLNSGFKRVETFNSDLISQVEKEAVLKKVKSGEIDLLYLSPETLLSYSIETIIGDREIGLLIIDEAHIVTTWGVGFRPDYWYLGGYINRLRNKIQTSFGKDRKTYHFPICAFTATAVNGGDDDTISDTIISLYMENPIKYIGYVRRENINFKISINSQEKLPKSEYDEKKKEDLDQHIQNWLCKKEKTIVYFPYATMANNAQKGFKEFANITTNPRIGIYTGRNIDNLDNEEFNEQKKETFEKFRRGTMTIMLATKAFGMGIDVDNVDNVYHYAVTGNLCDYVQEIGRAARRQSMVGYAITDFYHDDLIFMNRLFGMSQIRQYQIKKVIEGIYQTYKNKKENRNFLISPEAFTYIFNGKVKDDEASINKLKTCLLMLEKDFQDKYSFKVLISRPQSVFTKAFVVIKKDYEKIVLESKYSDCFKYIAKGRNKSLTGDNSLVSDIGDIYSIDLKKIWEDYHKNISFPQFKYWYFNSQNAKKEKVEIMPTIRDYIAPRQKINIETKGDYLLSDLRDQILEDLEYIGDELYKNFRNTYFTTNDFIKIIKNKYGLSKSRLIANSIFSLVDPENKCIKLRSNEAIGQLVYSLSNGNFKEYLKRPIMKSNVIYNISTINGNEYSDYISFSSDEYTNISLKLLSIFNYITYEVIGGQEPEIFIRLNDPIKLKNIAYGNTYYSNDYVVKAKKKHDRDVSILLNFFLNLRTNKERWDYIENYFLGHNVLNNEIIPVTKPIKMVKAIDKEKSYQLNQYNNWTQLTDFFDENDLVIINELEKHNIPFPEYLETILKKIKIGSNIIMSWPTQDTLICNQDISDEDYRKIKEFGWHIYKFDDIDYNSLKKDLS